ncbi:MULTISPECIES: energy transducer TonB [Henriciella]|uniref:energy transducer TonB n=1 Tax=Henriciella TaxID=453849 RepID=UPI00351315C7
MSYKKREKKSDTLEVRLPHSRKEAFKTACEEQGVTASHAVRTFVDAYIRRSRRVKLKTITQELVMTLIKNPLKTTGGLAAGASAIAAAFAIFALPSTAEPVYVDPIELPKPVYPRLMAEKRISSRCDSTFAISAKGTVEPGIKVVCTEPGFEENTRDAIRTLRFEPQTENGVAVRVPNATYTLWYEIRLEGESNAAITEDIFGPDR